MQPEILLFWIAVAGFSLAVAGGLFFALLFSSEISRQERERDG